MRKEEIALQLTLKALDGNRVPYQKPSVDYSEGYHELNCKAVVNNASYIVEFFNAVYKAIGSDSSQ